MTTQTQVNNERTEEDSKSKRRLIPAFAIATVFWAVGFLLWEISGYFEALLNFAYLGTSVGLGLGLYAVLPRKKKPQGRKLAQFLVGGYMLLFMGVFISNNVQIEGFFFSFLSGIMGAAITHYLMAKVLGPLLFGRLWCGWACWTAMVLDLLPFTRSPGRVPGKIGYLRYTHFALSGIMVFFLWVLIGPWVGQDNSIVALLWVISGNIFYYAAAIGLAYKYKDNRAFCKVLCPITTLLKITSRFSLIKVEGQAERCTECGACEKVCPMDIKIREYLSKGKRVTSTECILCQTCINSCPKKALGLSIGFDIGWKELLRVREE
ncbi:MAG: 4Fe-4S binding protein [Candidatus Thorarchaeota archaeon]